VRSRARNSSGSRATVPAVGPSAAADEEPEHGAAEGLAQGGAVICRPAGPAHEVAVGPEAAVGGADARADDAGRQPREIAEEVLAGAGFLP